MRTEQEIRDLIRESNIAKNLLTVDVQKRIGELHVELQAIETAKLAVHASKTLILKEPLQIIAGLVLEINAKGKWDTWINLSAHVDQVEIQITRRGNYITKLYQGSFRYRFDETHPWCTTDTESKKAQAIISVLNDFLSDHDVEQHFNTEEW